MTSLWVQEIADWLWSEAGGPPAGFPRDVREAALWALPLATIDLPRLHLGAITDWLATRGVALPLPAADRRVRACLVTVPHGGLIFLDGADPPDERRFSLAHEVAHFIVERVAPRQRALERLGPTALELLDGDRAPTVGEQLVAAVHGIDLQPHLHLLERIGAGLPAHATISLAERRADELAIELLAPIEVVRAALPPSVRRAAARACLHAQFGLPAAVAEAYARQLTPDEVAPTSLAAYLGLE